MMVHMTETQRDRAFEVAAMIGEAIRAGREAAGESQDAAARAERTRQSALGALERGASYNAKLGNLVKFLDRYGLELAVRRQRPLAPHEPEP